MALKNETEIASIRARLKELDAERDVLTVCLERLVSQPSSGANSKSVGASVTAASAAADKITLFRRLFAIRRVPGEMGKSQYREVRLCACLRE
jgi:hypothetical protein